MYIIVLFVSYFSISVFILLICYFVSFLFIEVFIIFNLVFQLQFLICLIFHLGSYFFKKNYFVIDTLVEVFSLSISSFK